MPRAGVRYEQVCSAIDSLTAEGIQPTIRKIGKSIGSGSFTTIQQHFQRYREAKQEQGLTETEAVVAPEELQAAICAFVSGAVAHVRADFEEKLAAACDDTSTLAASCEILEVERDSLREELATSNKETAELRLHMQELAAETGNFKAQQTQLEALIAAVEKLSSKINEMSTLHETGLDTTISDSHCTMVSRELEVAVAVNSKLASELQSERDRSRCFKNTIATLKDECARQAKNLDENNACMNRLREIVESESEGRKAAELRNETRLELAKDNDVQADHAFDITKIFACNCSSM